MKTLKNTLCRIIFLTGALFCLTALGANVFAADGALDQTYTAVFDAPVNDVVVQPDGKAVAVGAFSTYKGTARAGIARINADATLDTTFNPGTGFDSTQRAVALQPDGKIVVGGEFSSYNGTTRIRVARINADGSLDTTFNPGTGANARVYALALQADGKIVIGGEFTNYNGTAVNRIARLNADGTFDSTFITGTGFDVIGVFAVKLQADGKVVAGGYFSNYNGTPRSHIVRINSNGSNDTTFNPGAGADGSVNSISVQSDGKIIIGGVFINFNNVSSPRIARLNTDGSRDSTFSVGTGYNNIVRSTALQPDGKVLVGCDCSAYNGTSFAGINRLNTNGSLDATFDSGNIINSAVLTIAQQPDGKILIGGNFTYISNTSQNYERLFRLNGPSIAPTAGLVSIGGRISARGRAVANAKIELIGTGGAIQLARSNTFGYFNFKNVEAGATYIISVSAKRYVFAPQVVWVTEDVSALSFTGQ